MTHPSRWRLCAAMFPFAISITACAPPTPAERGSGQADSSGKSDNPDENETDSETDSASDNESGSTTTTTGPATTTADPSDSAFTPGPTVAAPIFEREHVYWLTGDDRRMIDVVAALPEAPAGGPTFSYEKVRLDFALDCPDGRCDWWDRPGYLAIMKGEETIEIARFMTPYGVAGSWSIDVTDLQPVLAGDVTFRVNIQTWVGPGHEQGDGWLFSASLDYVGGTPSQIPIEVVPLWTMREVPYGEPEIPIAQSAPDQTLALPSDEISGAKVRSIITGHGQGNLDNCAEFCVREHRITVGGQAFPQTIWRDDCESNPVNNQLGNWEFDRAGWCPGAEVQPWTVDVSSALGTMFQVGYDVEAYVNTCRPEAEVCQGCSLGTGCEYDGGNHTNSRYWFSSLLIYYR